jgi:cytochrome c oxidase subunit 1
VSEFQGLHVASTIGAYVLAIGMLIVAVNLVASMIKGRKAPMNPWGAATLDWETESPPIAHNFHEQPLAGDPYAVDKFQWDEAQQGYVRVLPKEVSHAAL